MGGTEQVWQLGYQLAQPPPLLASLGGRARPRTPGQGPGAPEEAQKPPAGVSALQASGSAAAAVLVAALPRSSAAVELRFIAPTGYVGGPGRELCSVEAQVVAAVTVARPPLHLEDCCQPGRHELQKRQPAAAATRGEGKVMPGPSACSWRGRPAGQKQYSVR